MIASRISMVSGAAARAATALGISIAQIFSKSHKICPANIAPTEPESFPVARSEMLKSRNVPEGLPGNIYKLWYEGFSHLRSSFTRLVRVAGDLRNRLRPVPFTSVLPEKQQFRHDIIALQEAMQQLPGALTAADYETRHYFTPLDETYKCAAYARVIFLPKGHIIIGKIHKHAHLNFILKGQTSVATEFGKKYFTAPCVFISEPGLKRAVFVEADTIWATVHLTGYPGEENLELIEEEVIAKTYDDLTRMQ